MRTIRTVSELRAAVSPTRRSGATLGLVPTMGALHEGHLSLVRRARRECQNVVVSLFVNPSQFNEANDLAAYPRDEERDRALAAEAGADLLFAPAAREIYPPGFCTSIQVSGLDHMLEGEIRGPEHFRGVATVVLKLLNIVGPDRAYFGQKDAQQAALIGRLTTDLNVPVEIVVCPTVREGDGLAMSSRNARLTTEQREHAVALSRGLTFAERAVAGGERSAAVLLETARDAMLELGVTPEYLALVDPHSLTAVQLLTGPALLAVAARLGATRLIDNTILDPARPFAEAHQEPRLVTGGVPSAPLACS
jgi:pantoate--beta-alanine ligase